MTDAPDTIHCEPPDIFDDMGIWYAGERSGLVEYRRADIPPTLAQALALPEVAALVEALGEIAATEWMEEEPGSGWVPEHAQGYVGEMESFCNWAVNRAQDAMKGMKP